MIENVKKLFAYNWSDVIANLKSSDKAIEVPEDVAKSIKTGFTLSFIYAGIVSVIPVLSIIVIVIFAGTQGFAAAAAILIGAVITFGISFAILYFLMKFLTEGKERTAIRYIVVLVLCALGILMSVLSIISSLGTIGRTPTTFLGNLVGLAVSFLAYANVAVGCIDFCFEVNK